MSVRSLLTLIIVAAGLLAPAAIADAATKKKRKAPVKYPTVTKIAPMKVGIGDTMTITGKNFIKGKRKNTVVFRRDGKRAIFVKADGLSTKRLRLKITSKLESALGKRNGAPTSTRFRVRVLAKRFGKKYTALKKSPTVIPVVMPVFTTPPVVAARTQAVVVAAPPPVNLLPAETPPPPPDCDGDGTIDDLDSDDDNDLLVDTVETSIGTNRCAADTDGDGMEDGWEYKSAIDFNQPSCPDTEYPVPCAAVRPYPKKMPYPNPLDSDANMDYDGDFLSAGHEHAAWRGKPDRNLTTLWYSEGLQSSIDSDAGDGCRGMRIPTPLMGRPEYTLDRHNMRPGDVGCLSDDERDEDGDYLTNSEELVGALSNTKWWQGVFEEPGFRYTIGGTDWLDRDSDGDGVWDGVDDNDQDGFWNVEEIERGTPSAAGGVDTGVRTGLWVDPFNPCLPAPTADKCPRGLLLDGDAWRPFYKDTPPTTRWPLYGHDVTDRGGYVSTEIFDGITHSQQVLPPVHPLLPRPN